MTDEQTLALLSPQDQRFLQQFEQLSLPPEQFNHLGHLRIAWLYLLLNQQAIQFASKDPLQFKNKAIVQVCSGIKAYAESLGAAMKYDKKITTSLIIIIEKRMLALMRTLKRTRLTCNDWPLFVEKNVDLVDDAIGVLNDYYSDSSVDS